MEYVEGEVSKFQTLTQEAVSEQIRRIIAPLISQLQALTRLVQEMVTTQHPDHYHRTDYCTTSGTATYQCDNQFPKIGEKMTQQGTTKQLKEMECNVVKKSMLYRRRIFSEYNLITGSIGRERKTSS